MFYTHIEITWGLRKLNPWKYQVAVKTNPDVTKWYRGSYEGG
ncbi:MAG: hypothetical protein QXZ41_05275 [Ignisphaera sp.]